MKKIKKDAEALKPVQRKILDFIRSFLSEKGYPPTIREIGDGVSLRSTSSVFGNLQKLEEKGYIRRDPTRSRSIEIVEPETDDTRAGIMRTDCIDVPIVKSLSPETHILSPGNIDGYLPVLSGFLRDKPAFVFPVPDENMTDAGIYPGDYLLLEELTEAENGDAVLVLTDNSAKIKRFYQNENGEIRLDSAMGTISFIPLSPEQSFSIAGKVIGYFHKVS